MIALGNGSADLMGAIVAAHSDVLIVVGSIFGASLFVTTIVFGRVLSISKRIKVLLFFLIIKNFYEIIGKSIIYTKGYNL